MSAFSDNQFNSAGYSSYRPSYNKEFFQHIFDKYPLDNHSLALDIGCGTGQVAKEIAGNFDNVIGTDLSPTMIETATAKNTFPNVEYHVSGAEKLELIKSGTVDLVTCAQACHWFDHAQWFEELYRVLAPKGLLVYFGYADPYFPEESEAANKLWDNISYGEEWLGPYWEQPGRNIVRNLLVDVDAKLPRDKFKVLQISKNNGEPSSQCELHIERNMKLGDYMNYIQTFSAYHAFNKQNPQVRNTINEMLPRIYNELNAKLGWTMNKELKVLWKTCYTVARRL